ncbi:hypothetical protein Hamer_G027209, partial [Homarus americanus]
MVDCISSVLKR